MRIARVLLVAVAAAALAPTPVHAGGGVWLRRYMAAYTARRAAHTLIPAWARKYNMNCSGCHYPAPPRLNATGTRFKWAGYRMPDDFDESVTVEKVQNYLSFRGRMKYQYDKTAGQPASNSSFAFEDATVFYGGPYGRNYSGFFELEREAENSVELVANVGAKWGRERAYGGFRLGQFHWLLREGLAGFDRPTGIRTPIPVGGVLTGSLPFTFANDQVGVEGFYVRGNNRLSAELLNGINAAGKGDEGDIDTKKDLVVIDQLLIDDAGSGVTAVGYYGTIVGADTLSPTATSHFWRLGITANKIVNNFEILGGAMFAKDQDLPTGTGTFAAAANSGRGYWVSGQYLFPKRSLTVFGRYEFLDPNTSTANDGKSRVVAGAVLPLNLPEYLRLALEYAVDVPQASGAPKQHSVAAQLMLNF